MHAILMRLCVMVGLAAFAGGWPALSSQAQDRQPTPLACTCELVHGNYETSTNVDNATLCVQQIEKRECRVTVHCLLTGEGPGCEARTQTENIANEASGLIHEGIANVDETIIGHFAEQEIDILIGILNNHFEYNIDQIPETENIISVMRKTLDSNSARIVACVQQYAGRLKRSDLLLSTEEYSMYFKTIDDTQFFCGVDEETRWLQVAIPTGGQLFLIQFAPLD